jgi:1,4-dihydroxy-6-naphthoate synthase
MQKISLAISPCPNDTFIFDALIHQKIDTQNIDFEIHFADVEVLNQSALKQKYDITKLSYFAYTKVAQDYILLNAGSALGNNCGPILIAKKHFSELEINNIKIGIPGELTTANFLFSLKFPEAKHKKYILFSDVETQLLNNEIDAGVIIHENRFTYQEKGLNKIVDLGEYWEQTYHAPIPLGGIVVRRDFDFSLQKKVNQIIHNSIEFAFNNRTAPQEFIKKHAQELRDEVIAQHIALYVNQYSLDLGENGKNAIRNLYQIATEKNIIAPLPQTIFVE